jgi:hypothetical protein
MRMTVSKKPSSVLPPVHVGDGVRFKWGFDDTEGVVIEDRGPLGIGGRRLYRIAVSFEIGEDMTVTLPVSEFVVVKPASNGTVESETA